MLSFVRAFASVLLGSLDRLRLELRAVLLEHALDVQVRVPHVEVLHRREARPSRCGTRPTVSSTIRSCVLGAEAVVARRDQHAHGQPLDVPLPRTRERLVEVVDVEHQPPLRRREHPEVRQVRVPAALHRQPRPRRRREVVGHDHRRPAIERERRDQHPPVADRHQLRHARLRLALEQLDRIGATRRAARTPRGRRAAPRCAPPCPRATRSATDRCGTAGAALRPFAPTRRHRSRQSWWSSPSSSPFVIAGRQHGGAVARGRRPRRLAPPQPAGSCRRRP